MAALSNRPNRFYPSIPGVTEDPNTHTNALQQIRESIETHERRNSNYLKSFIRFEELVDIGIIDESGELLVDFSQIASGGGAVNLGELGDVTISAPNDNDILGYNAATAEWTAQNAAELNLATLDDLAGVGGSTTLAGLTDVDVTGGQQYDLLYQTGSGWEPTKGELQFDGSDVYIPQGNIEFGSVGGSNPFISSTAVNIRLNAPNGAIEVDAGTYLDLLDTSMRLDSGRPINWQTATDTVALLDFRGSASTTPLDKINVYQATSFTTTNTTFTAVPEMVIPASNLTVGRNYLFVSTAKVGQTFGGVQQAKWQLNGVDLNGSLFQIESDVGSGLPTVDGESYQYMTVVENYQGGDFQFYIRRATTSGTSFCNSGMIFVLDITDLTKDTDWFFNENTTLTALTTSNLDFANVTIGDGTSDYWIMYAMSFQDSNGTTRDTISGLSDGAFDDDFILRSSEGGGDDQTHLAGDVWAAVPAATTYSAFAREADFQQTSHKRSGVFALRLNALSNYAFITEDPPSLVQGAPDVIQDLSYTPTQDVNVQVFTNVIDNCGSSTITGTHGYNYDIDGGATTEVRAGAWYVGFGAQVQHQMQFPEGDIALTAGQTLNIDSVRYNESANQGAPQRSSILVMELAAKGASNTFFVGDPGFPTQIDGTITTITGGAVINGATRLDSTLSAAGATTLNSTLGVAGNTILGGTLDVTGAADFSSTLSAAGNTTLGGTLDVTGAADFSSTLSAAGATTLNSTLGVAGNTTLGGTLDVTGAADFSSTLDVAGLATFGDDIQMADLVGDRIALFESLGSATGYAIGIEAFTQYYKSQANYRWYINQNADGGSGDTMELSASALTLNTQLLLNNSTDLQFSDGVSDTATFGLTNGTTFGSIFAGLADWDITGLTGEMFVDADLRTSGNLTVGGTTTTVNSNTVSIADNIILLNSDAAGAPTENAGFEVERGTSANVQLRWNETADDWEITYDGSTFYGLLTDNDTAGGMLPTGGTVNASLYWTGSEWAERTAIRLASDHLDIRSAAPTIWFYETDAAVNNQNWYLGALSESFTGRVYDDAFTSSTPWLNVTRTLNTIDEMQLGDNALNIVPAGAITIKHNGLPTFITSAEGFRLLSEGNTDTENRLLRFQYQNGIDRGLIGHVSTDAFEIWNRIHGGNIELAAEDSGGTLRTLFNGNPDGGVDLYNAGSIRFSVRDSAATIRGNANNDPTTGGAQNVELNFATSGGTEVGDINYLNSADMYIRNLVHGGRVIITAQDTATGASKNMAFFDPDNNVTLRAVSAHDFDFDNGENAITTAVNGAVSLYFNGAVVLNTNTVGTELLGTLNNAVGGSVNTYQTFSTSTGSDRGYVGFLNTASLEMRSANHGAPILMSGEDTGGTLRTLFAADPDGESTIYRNGSAKVVTSVFGMDLRADGNSGTPTALLDIKSANGVDTHARVGYAASADFEIRAQIHGGSVLIKGEDSAGTSRNLFVGDPDGQSNLFFTGSRVAFTHADGLHVRDANASSPFIGWYNSADARQGYIQFGSNAIFRSEVHGATIRLEAEDNAGVVRTVFIGDPDAGATLYYAGNGDFGLQDKAATGNTNCAFIIDHNSTTHDVGYNDQVAFGITADLTLDDQHAGKTLTKTVTTAGIDITCPTGAQFPTGSVVNIANLGNSTMQVLTTGITLEWPDGSTVNTGTRTLAYGAYVSLWRRAASVYVIIGSGIS